MKKICLLGTAPSSRLTAPFQDESYEIWVCSAGNSQASAPPRITKWFELHAICDMLGAENKVWSIPYYQWLRAQKFPVYMQEKNDLVPQAIIFPYKQLTERFGPNPKKGLANWFTSSIAWMWAYALIQMTEGDEIAIFGVDMAAAEEAYTAQKAGLHRFVEYSRAMGVHVTIPYESCLVKTLPLYGYSEATPFGRKLQWRKHEMKNIKQQLDVEIRQKELQRAFFEGAIEGVEYDLRTWPDGMDADLDDESDGRDGVMDALKAKADQYAKQTPLTGDFMENSAGVFVPMGTANGNSGSTVTVDPVTGAKHYSMACEPGKFSAEFKEPEQPLLAGVATEEEPKKRKSKNANGLRPEA